MFAGWKLLLLVVTMVVVFVRDGFGVLGVRDPAAGGLGGDVRVGFAGGGGGVRVVVGLDVRGG